MSHRSTPPLQSPDPIVQLRVPQALHDELQAYARGNAREFKKELIIRLHHTLKYQQEQFALREMIHKAFYEQ